MSGGEDSLVKTGHGRRYENEVWVEPLMTEDEWWAISPPKGRHDNEGVLCCLGTWDAWVGERLLREEWVFPESLCLPLGWWSCMWCCPVSSLTGDRTAWGLRRASWKSQSQSNRRDTDCHWRSQSSRPLEALHPFRRGEHHFPELHDWNLLIPGAMSLSCGVPVTWLWEMDQQPGQNVPHAMWAGSPSMHRRVTTLVHRHFPNWTHHIKKGFMDIWSPRLENVHLDLLLTLPEGIPLNQAQGAALSLWPFQSQPWTLPPLMSFCLSSTYSSLCCSYLPVQSSGKPMCYKVNSSGCWGCWSFYMETRDPDFQCSTIGSGQNQAPGFYLCSKSPPSCL